MRLPRESAPAPDSPSRPEACGPTIRAASSGPLLILVEQFAKLGQFFLGCLTRRERAHHQGMRRPGEGALQQVTRQLPLRPFARARRLIDVGSLLLIAAHQSFFG